MPRHGNQIDCDEEAGRAAVVTLPAGTYRAWILVDHRPGRIEWSGTWRLRDGTYQDCLVDVRR